MQLKITHRIELTYDQPVRHSLQRLRLVPHDGVSQTVRPWALAIGGAREELRFTDQFTNETVLISVEGEPRTVVIEAKGEVVTHETSGVAGKHRGFAPLWLFLQETAATAAGDAIHELAASSSGGTEIEKLHGLMAEICEGAARQEATANTDAGAEPVGKEEEGVARDRAHAFISAARLLHFPARFVSGYRFDGHSNGNAALHGWAEAHVRGLGWVGFDLANCISPDERYVRLATGRDYCDAAPISGISLPVAPGQLAVRVIVEQ
jgi:transglutaminase-like putative cysteine protease